MSYVWQKKLQMFLVLWLSGCCVISWLGSTSAKSSDWYDILSGSLDWVLLISEQTYCCLCTCCSVYLLQMFVADANVLRLNSYSQSEQNDLMKCNVVGSVGRFWSFWTVLKHGFLWCVAHRHSERNTLWTIKKGGSTFVIITLGNLEQFLYFLHCCKEEEFFVLMYEKFPPRLNNVRTQPCKNKTSHFILW